MKFRFNMLNLGGEDMEVFPIEWENEYHVFLLDDENKILDSCTLQKP